MTNNQEKFIKQKIDKWLEGKGGTQEERERRSAAWMKYFSELKVPKPVYLLAAVTWLCSGAVILPEDMPKVEQAVRVAEINHVDPLRYARPMEIIDAFPGTELKEALIDPDTVSTLHLVRKFDSGLAIYDVDESEESRQNMRRIINTHFGKDSSPWCLLQGDDNGNLTEQSGRYWDYYSGVPKQVAFFDGKLAAFSAMENPKEVSWWDRGNDGDIDLDNNDAVKEHLEEHRTWWDRTDNPNEKVVITGKIKEDILGRFGNMKIDTWTGDISYENIYRFGNGGWGLERYHSLEDNVPYKIEQKANPNATSIRIQEGVISIEDRTFMGCSSLREVHIPEGVTEIGHHAFDGCSSLREVHIPESVTEIGHSAFEGCSSLQKVYIPEGVTKIGHRAFDGCSSLREVHIPSGVTEIGPSAFEGCSILKEIYVPLGVSKSFIRYLKYFVPDGCSIIRELTKGDRNALLRMGADEEVISLLEKDCSACLESPYFSPIIDGDEYIPERIKGGSLPLFIKEGDVFVCVPGAPEVTVRQFVEMAEKDPALVASACRAVDESLPLSIAKNHKKENLGIS